MSKLEEEEEIFANAEIIEEEVDCVDAESTPTEQDQNWTEYVLSLMYADELRDGHPTVDGLRRITERILGEVFAVESEILQVPGPDNNYHATVKVRVVAEGRSADGCADVGPNNTESKFAIHAVATAESRAESRAYRRLLRLRNIISAEENVKTDEICDLGDTIQDHQLNLLDIQAKKGDINVETWLATEKIKLVNLREVSKAKGAELCEKMNTLKAQGVPEELKGYNPNWR